MSVDIAAVQRLVRQAMTYNTPETRLGFLKRATMGDEALFAQATHALQSADLTTGFLATGEGIPNVSPSLKTGEIVGPWRVTDVLGSGGMGDVYAVSRSDGHFDMTAALKVISASSEIGLERFSRERQILANLDHPNIARLIDGGMLPDGRSYLVMEQVQGRSTAEGALDSLDEKEKLAAFIALCQALEHAHEKLVLHGDIKPSNVLISQSGDLKLVDFGVAALLSEQDSTLKTPITLAYAAPEQIEGQSASLRSDIYSLGLTLAEWLTGVLPTDEAFHGALKSLKSDLQAIIGKATATEPAARYGSVGQFRDDIERFLDGRAISARPHTVSYRTGVFLKRYPVLTLFAAAFVLSLVGGLIGTSLFAIKAQKAAESEAIARIQAETQTDIAIEARNLLISVIVEALYSSEEGEADIGDVLDTIRQTAIEDLDSNPGQARMTLYTLSTIHDGRGDIQQVIETLTPIFEREDVDDMATVQSLITYGLYTMDSELHDRAQPALERAIAIMDRHDQPEFYRQDRVLAESYLSSLTGDPERMLASVDQLDELAISLSSGNNRAKNQAVSHWDEASFLAIQAGDADRAIELGEKALALNKQIEGPKNLTDEEIAFVLVGSYASQERLEEALKLNAELIEEATRLYGPSVALANRLLMQGMLHSRSDQPEEALEAFLLAEPMYAEFDREQSELRFSTLTNIARERVVLSNSRKDLSQFEVLLAEFGHLFEDYPRYGYFFHKRRGEAHEYLGDYDIALAEYQTAIDYAREGRREDYVQNGERQLQALKDKLADQ